MERFAWSDVVRIGGAEVALASSVLSDAYRALGSEALPARLRVAPVETTPLGPDRVRVTAYRAYDPLEIPKALGDVLHFFDGRDTPSTLLAISADSGIELDTAVVRRLVDFDVLVEDHSEPGDSRE